MACWVGCSVTVQLEMSTSLAPALYSSMNEFVGLFGEPLLTRNSLILIEPTFRIFSAAVSEDFLPFAWFVHKALPIRSPLNAVNPEVTLKVALTLAPGATGSANIFDASLAPEATTVHPFGTATLN